MFNFVSDQTSISFPIHEQLSKTTSGANIEANIHSGQLRIEQDDLLLAGLGLDLHVKRYYDSRLTEGNPWRICATPTLHVNQDQPPHVTDTDGTVIPFHVNQGVLVSYAGYKGEIRLEKQNSQYCMYKVATGDRYYFHQNGDIDTHENAFLGRIKYQYQQGILESITNASGQTVNIIRNNRGLIDKLEVNGKVYVQYVYDERSNQLTTVIYRKPDTLDEYAVHYTYHNDTNFIQTISEDNGEKLECTFMENKIHSITDGEKSYTLQYLNNQTTVIHDDGQQYQFKFDKQRVNKFTHITHLNADSFYREYAYQNQFEYVSSVVGSDGASESYLYDDHAWISQHQKKMDDEKFETNYFTRNDTGQIRVERKELTNCHLIPTIRNVYLPGDSYLLRFKVTGENQVTEYIYDDRKQLVREYRYLEKYNGYEITYENLAAWALNNNQRQQSERIDYTYNLFGDLHQEKHYPYLEAGGEPDVSQERVETQQTDIHGRVSTISNNKNPDQPKHHDYDAISREVSLKNFFGHMTKWEYIKAQNGLPSTMKMTYPSGLMINRTFDQFGKVEREVEFGSINGSEPSLLKTTFYRYDRNRLYCIEEIDELTHEHRYQYIRYDGFGRPCLNIDQDGYATEHVRDIHGRAVKTISYGLKQIVNTDQALSLKQLNELVIQKDENHDRVRDTVYDHLNRVRFTINARGMITETIYNSTGNANVTIQYAKALSVLDRKTVVKLSSIERQIIEENLRDNPKNRVTYHFHDSDGFEILTIQPNGGVIAYTRDPQGNITQTIRYANPLFYTLETLPNTAQEVMEHITASPEDIVEYAYYNKCNDIVAMIDGEGFVTEYIYDKLGDKSTEIQFAQKIDTNLLGQEWSAEVLGLNRDDPANQTFVFQHDAEHRELTRKNKFGDMLVQEYSFWDDPDSVYEHATSTYSVSNKTVLMAQGMARIRDCRGNTRLSLDSIGMNALLNEVPGERSKIWNKYATTHVIDGFRREKKSINNLGNPTEFSHAKRGFINYIKNPESEIRTRKDNAFQELIEETIHVDQKTKSVTQHILDKEGNEEKSIDADGFEFLNEFNLFNEATKDKVVLLDGRVVETDIIYDKMGDIEQKTQKSGHSTRALVAKRHDVFRRLRMEALGNGDQTLYDFDRRHAEIERRFTRLNHDDNNFKERRQNDAFGRETFLKRYYKRHGIEEQHTNTTQYGNDKRKKTITSSGNGRTSEVSIWENGFGDTIEENKGNGQLLQTYVNPNHDAIERIKNGVIVEKNAHDTLGQLKTSVDANGTEVSFERDKISRIKKKITKNKRRHAAADYDQHVIENKWNPLGITDEISSTRTVHHDYFLKGDKKRTVEDSSELGVQRTHDYIRDALRSIQKETLSSPKRGIEREVETLIDDFGRPCGTMVDPDGLKIVNRQKFDDADKLIEEEDGIGRKTYYCYEDHGHTKMTIRPSGSVVIEYFNLDMLLMKQVAFFKPLSAEQILQAISQQLSVDVVSEMLGNEQHAFVENFTYSTDKHLLSSYSSLSEQIISLHNNAGQEIEKVQSDRHAKKIFDHLGYVAYEIDAENYVNRLIHDNAGNLLIHIRYAKKIASQGITSFDQMEKEIALLASDHDRFDYHRYDMMNRELFLLNAEGSLKQTIYNDDGLDVNTCILDKRFPIPSLITSKTYLSLLDWMEGEASPESLAQWVLNNRVYRNDVDEPVDHEKIKIRDTLGRIEAEIDSLGNATQYEHNLSDQIVTETNSLGGVTVNVFDLVGRIEKTSHPEREVTAINRLTGAVDSRRLMVPITMYVHDNANQLNVERRTAQGAQAERVTEYGYDLDGNRNETRELCVSIYDDFADAENPQNTGRIEKDVDLVTAEIFNAFKQAIKRTTPDQAVSYHVYGTHKKLVFSIDPEGYVTHYEYDLYLNTQKVTRYAKPIRSEAYSLLNAITTPEQLAPYIVRDPSNDRFICSQFDKLNRHYFSQEPDEIYFDPTATDKEEQYFLIGKQTTLILNAFGDVLIKKMLLNPYLKTFLQERQFFNRAGDVIAEVNADLFLIVFGLFSLNHEWRTKIEYSNPLLPSQLNADNLTLPSLPVQNPDKDRQYERKINGEGLVTQEIARDWLIYEIDKETKSVSSKQIHKHTAHEFDGEKNETVTRIRIVNATDGVEVEKRAVFQFYNLASLKIAQLDTKRRVRKHDGTDALAHPLTCFGYNHFDESVLTEQSDMIIAPIGTNHVERQKNLMNDIKENRETSIWHRESYLIEKIGKPIISFQANGFKVAMSYDVMKRIAKEWVHNPFYTLSDKKLPAPLIEQYATLTRYDLRSYKNLERKYDREAVVDRFAVTNGFGEIDREGVRYGGSLKPFFVPESLDGHYVVTDPDVRHIFTRSGDIRKTNAQDGVWKLLWRNLAGTVTAKVTSQVHHLGQEKFTPKYLCNLPLEEYQMTVYVPNHRQHILETRLPSMSQSQNPLFTSVIVGEPDNQQNKDVFGTYAIIWKRPTSFQAKSRFKIKLKDADSSQWREYPVIETETEMGVNLSALTTDHYDYHIQFFHIVDNKEVLYASGIETLSIINGNQSASTHLVCKMVSHTKMLIAGKTRDTQGGVLTGLQLLEDFEPYMNVGVLPLPDGNYEANFDHIPTGAYQVRRADIDQPIGDPFDPTLLDKEKTFNLNKPIYTDITTDVEVKVDRTYEPEMYGEPPKHLNHVFTYTMTIELTANVHLAPFEPTDLLEFHLTVVYASGRHEKHRGTLQNERATIIVILYQESVPYVAGQPIPDPASIDIKVDSPIAVENVLVQAITNNLMININPLEVYDAPPGATRITIPYQNKGNDNNKKLSPPSKPQRYIHVNTDAVRNRGNKEILALKIASKGVTIAPKKRIDHYQRFDVSEYPRNMGLCQLMGASDKPVVEKTQKHSQESTYVDTRVMKIQPNLDLVPVDGRLPQGRELLAIQHQQGRNSNAKPNMNDLALNRSHSNSANGFAQDSQYQITENCLINANVRIDTDRYQDKHNDYQRKTSIVFSDPRNYFNNMSSLRYVIEYDTYFDYDNTYEYHMTSLFYNGLNVNGVGHYVNVYRSGTEIYLSLHQAYNHKGGHNVKAMIRIHHIEITDVQSGKAMIIYNDRPNWQGLTWYNNYYNKGSYAHRDSFAQVYHYQFKTSPYLTDDIVSLNVFKNNTLLGLVAINRPGLKSTYYMSNLTHLLADFNGLSFQLMGANPVNNYLIENPMQMISSGLFKKLAVVETCVNVRIQKLESMVWKKCSTGGIFPTEYEAWGGRNIVHGYIHADNNLLDKPKSYYLRYVLKSKTNVHAEYTSEILNVRPYDSYFVTYLPSPNTRDVNIPASLVSVTQCTLHVQIGDALVEMYRDAPDQPKYYIFIAPFPTNAEKIEFHYQSELDNEHHWVVLEQSNIHVLPSGTAIIRSDLFLPAHYRYRTRAFRADKSMIDLSGVAQKCVDPQGYAYGDFVITKDTRRLVQVPHVDPSATQHIAPVLKSTVDFKGNVVSETDAKSQTRYHEYDKQDILTLTRLPASKYIKPETGVRLNDFSAEKLSRSDDHQKKINECFELTIMGPMVFVKQIKPAPKLKTISIRYQQNKTFEIDMSLSRNGIYEGFMPLELQGQQILPDRVNYDTDPLQVNQYIDNAIPEELIETVEATTRTLPNAFGEEVASQDAHGHWHLYCRQDAGMLDYEWWPDGGETQYHQSIFGHEVLRIEPTGLETRSINNPHGVPVQVSRGSQGRYAVENFELEYRDQVIYRQDAGNGISLFRLNSLEQITDAIDADGIKTVKLYDVSSNVFQEMFADGRSNKFCRDGFGYVVYQSDRADIIVRNQYNFLMLPTLAVSDPQNNRSNAQYDENTPLPRMKLSYRYYSNGKFYMLYSSPFVDDNSKPFLDQGILLYRYDDNLMTVGEHFWMNGKVWKDMIVVYNPLNRINFVADRDYTLENHEDRNGNVRAMVFKGADPSNPNRVIEDVTLWNTFNTVNQPDKSRMLRDKNGILVESSRYFSVNTAYRLGRMISQRYYHQDKKIWMNDQFEFNTFSFINKIMHSDGRETELTHSPIGLLTNQVTYKSMFNRRVVDESTANDVKPSGVLVAQHYRKDDTETGRVRAIFDLRDHTRNEMNTLIASQHEIHAHVNDEGESVDHITNDITRTYADFAHPVEAKVDLVTTFHDEDKISSNSMQLYFTETGNTRKKVDRGYPHKTSKHITMPTGEALYREEGDLSDPSSQRDIARTSRHADQIIAQCMKGKDDVDFLWEIGISSQPFAENAFASQPIAVSVAKDNMTLADIASIYCSGRAGAAGWLQQYNPQYTVNQVLPIGAVIIIPYGQSSLVQSYAGMLGNTVPQVAPYYVKMPKQKNQWMMLIPMAVGVAVSLFVAPQFATLFGNQLLGLIAAGAAAGAAGNLSAQATANLLNLSNGIDWAQVSTATVMGAVTSGMDGAHNAMMGMEQGSKAAQTIATMHQAAIMNLAQQAYLLSTGQQEQFSWQAMVASTVMSVAHAEFDDHVKMGRAINDISKIMMTQVMNEQVRSMHSHTAFRGSNIYSSAAQELAMYGVATVTTKAMVRFSQPTPEPAPKPAPKPAPEPVAPVQTNTSTARRQEPRSKSSAASSGPEPKPKPKTKPQAKTTDQTQNLLPIQSLAQPAIPTDPFEFMDSPEYASMRELSNQVGEFENNKSKKLTRAAKYVNGVWTAIEVPIEASRRYNNPKYADSSVASRYVCSAVGVVGDYTVTGTLHAGTAAMLSPLSATGIGAGVTVAFQVAMAPSYSKIGGNAGDIGQQTCHDVFNMRSK